MIDQICVMMHSTLYTLHLYVMDHRPVWKVFPFAHSQCCDVDASWDYKGSISQTTQEVTCQSSRGHVMFIYKNDSEEGTSRLLLNFVWPINFSSKIKITKPNNPQILNYIWFRLPLTLLWVFRGDCGRQKINMCIDTKHNFHSSLKITNYIFYNYAANDVI